MTCSSTSDTTASSTRRKYLPGLCAYHLLIDESSLLGAQLHVGISSVLRSTKVLACPQFWMRSNSVFFAASFSFLFLPLLYEGSLNGQKANFAATCVCIFSDLHFIYHGLPNNNIVVQSPVRASEDVSRVESTMSLRPAFIALLAKQEGPEGPHCMLCLLSKNFIDSSRYTRTSNAPR